MKKITSFMLMLLCAMTAWADLTQNYYMNTNFWSKAESYPKEQIDPVLDAAKYDDGSALKGGNTVVQYANNEFTVVADGNVVVTFTHQGGHHMLCILGVDVVDAEGNVVASDYHFGSAGGKLTDNVYTLEGLTAGTKLTLRSFVCDNTAKNDRTNSAQGYYTVTNATTKNNDVIIEDGWYAFKANNSSRYAMFNGERVIKATVENPSVVGITYYVTKGDGNKYTIQTPDGKFLTYKGTSNGDQIAVVAATDANDSNKWWTIRVGNANNLRTIVPSTNVGDGVSGWNFSVNFNGANGALGFYGCNDNGSQWVITKAPLMTVGKAKIKCANTVMSYNGENIVKADDENSIFTISKNADGNKFAIQTVGGKYVVNKDGVSVVDAADATDENKWWSIVMNIGNGAEGAVDILQNDDPKGNTPAFNWAKSINGVANAGLGYWDANDNNSYCTIEWVETVECTYNLVYNNETKVSYTTQVVVGDFYPTLNKNKVTLPYGVDIRNTKFFSPITAEDLVDGKIVKNVTNPFVSTLPFVSAADYNSIENWYFMKNKGEFYLSHNATLNHIALGNNQKNIDLNNRDAFSWAFIGNPFDGFQIVNKAAGEGYILSSSTTLEGNTGAGTYPVLTKTPVSEGNNTLWMITSSTHQTNGFYLAQKGFENNRMNNRDNILAYWNTGADNGSTFTVELRDDALIDVATVEEFKSRVIPALGHVGGYALNTKETIEAIKTISEMEKFQSENDAISFDNNKYYRVQNVYRKTYISVNENKERVLKDASNADINQLWQIETTENGKYRIKSPNAGYMQAVGNNALVAENGAELNIVSFVEGAGQFAIKSGNDMLAGINSTTLGTWWNGSIDGDMSYRFLEADDVEITLSNINDEGWATAYLPFDVTLSEGLTAYYVNEINNKGGYVKFAEISDIPANNGVVLTGKPGVHKLNIAVANSEVKGNYLKGTTVTTEITKENGCAYYVMANDTEDGLGFYNAVLGEDDTKFKNTANKAYLYISGTTGTALSANLRFDFGGTTAIEEVETEAAETVIYDLTGRRVNEITKAGVYVVNGRKVLVK